MFWNCIRLLLQWLYYFVQRNYDQLAQPILCSPFVSTQTLKEEILVDNVLDAFLYHYLSSCFWYLGLQHHLIFPVWFFLCNILELFVATFLQHASLRRSLLQIFNETHFKYDSEQKNPRFSSSMIQFSVHLHLPCSQVCGHLCIPVSVLFLSGFLQVITAQVSQYFSNEWQIVLIS